MNPIAFDNELYIQSQSAHIRSRIEQFGGKLYLEFGGKLYDDHHASRVLPGFQPEAEANQNPDCGDEEGGKNVREINHDYTICSGWNTLSNSSAVR